VRILIVGAGIGGPTLAHWLKRAGHEPTLVERASAPRRGGYLVDFWGAGFDVAERMGIVPELLEAGHQLQELREVDSRGRRTTSFDPRDMAGIAGGRYVTIARADLASAIMSSLGGGVETIYGDSVSEICDDGEHVRVSFERGGSAVYDLVVGADGLHSAVRRMMFGPDDAFQRDVGIAVAAFDVEGYLPRDELVAVAHAEVGFQAVRLAMRDDATMFLLTFRHEGTIPEDDVGAQQQLLRRSLAGAGGEVPAILDRIPDARTFYFDKAAQIRMPSWSSGRVALIGDAAAAPSLLAGQGSALAMVEAYVLAAELDRADGDHGAAFAATFGRLGALVRAKQDAAIGLGTAFAPRNRAQLLLRNAIMRTMSVPLVARLAMGRSLSDPIALPPPAGG
jgi:2-polyprenyl-6-methoxyphenol hydroxylase-like FAD-dependent oxidoreductase